MNRLYHSGKTPETNSIANLLFFLAFSLTVLILLGCEGKEGGFDSLSDSVNQLGKRVKEYTPDTSKFPKMAEEEVEKLFRLDYQVIEFSTGESPETLQNKLSELGKDRWDCFHVQQRKEKLLLFCKRRPRSYIRYLGHLL